MRTLMGISHHRGPKGPVRSATRLLRSAALTAACVLASLPAAQGQEFTPDGKLVVEKRYRVESEAGSGRFHALVKRETWDPQASAIIVCDMWDSHHCLNAVRRRLLAAEGTSGGVTAAARSHGFDHFGRFAGDYRRYFGESPRETLHRA